MAYFPNTFCTRKQMLKSNSQQARQRFQSVQGAGLEQASSSLEKIVIGSLRRAPQGEAPLLAWPLVCGSAVAARTRALDFSGMVLRVEVPDAGWKREMQNLAPHYLANLNRYSGEKVSRIEFVIRRAQ
jgi:Dna[CI] antecedent, DciA